MKKQIRSAILSLLLPLVFTSIASAGPSPQAPQKGKVAVVNTEVLQAQIGEYRAKVEAINKQFDPRQKELQGLADRINALDTTINTQRSQLTPARIAEMTDQLDQMKREYQRKQEDLQHDGERALAQALNPVKEKLRKALEDYSAKRGIAVVVDIANAFEQNVLLWYDQRIDITQDFINEYNKANPVASSTPPKP
ncbi:MAG TPA: OmpH family outer membrane protein [Blastocatellia bacterium]|nr:OmpH family outer membrane protein [Blastocatellia bacterium]